MFAISTIHYITQYQSVKLNKLEDKVTVHLCWLQLTILVMYRLRYDTRRYFKRALKR